MRLAYSLEAREHVQKTFEKSAKKGPAQEAAVKNKIRQRLENPQHFKPLKKPMQGKGRVHVFGAFVLAYSVNEKVKTATIKDYDHRENICR